MDKLNSVIHTYSSKPILYGTRDSIIVATATVLVLVLLAFIYYFATNNLKYMGTTEYWGSVGKSFLLSFILGFVYEYGGINARFSAEAMRFAKGSVLSKYETRNAALIAEVAAEQYRKEVEREIKEGKCNIDISELNENIDRLNAMAISTREVKVIRRMFGRSTGEILQELKRKYGSKITAREVELLKNLDPKDPENNESRVNAVSRLVELFGTNPMLVRYFMKNGFSKLQAVKSMNGWTIDVKKLAADTGVTINLVGIGNGEVNGEQKA